ncbi:hypothetical protein [Sinorhizobium fredii]|uniref:hypothetical protein n=1 Tax=Rhizobium fredii TaxID=380 RepID=UPI00056AF9EE|nr:hypothetical protein [Sinorhizobium fredii]
MSEDWISVTEAVTRATLDGIPDAETALHDATERGKVETRIVEDEAPAIPDALAEAIYGDLWDVLRPPPSRQVWVKRSSLSAWIADLKDNMPLVSKPERRGRKAKLPWEDYYEAFAALCDVNGFPDDKNVDGWSKQADVERWINEQAQKEKKTVSESRAREHASTFMKRYEADN